jgi:hypothetical protein
LKETETDVELSVEYLATARIVKRTAALFIEWKYSFDNEVSVEQVGRLRRCSSFLEGALLHA